MSATLTRNYEKTKADAAKRSRTSSAAGRDIGPLPPIADPARRMAAGRDFALYCREYFPAVFTLPFSDDHRKVITKIESAVLTGGLFACAMPRGSGKTSLAETAVLWALLYGYRRFVALVGSDTGAAGEMLDSIKVELSVNETLAADFPAACFPIWALDGISQRAHGQLYRGRPTAISWTADEIVLPTIAGSAASGGAVITRGITGRIRGLKIKRADGTSERPSLVIVDDPQTDESANSPSQCQTREATVAGAILGLAGPGRKISGMMPCTVIRHGDMADRILNPDIHPEWNGERTKLVYRWPNNTKFWDQYAETRAAGLRAGDNGAGATEFYRQNREAADAGAVVAWAERHHPDELSAIQHAYNLRLTDESAFMAEYQNEPVDPNVGEIIELTAEQIAARVNGRGRGHIPTEAQHLTAMVDVGKKILWYAMIAWADDFTGWVVDYGSYPDQKRPYFTQAAARVTMAHKAPTMGIEGALYAALEKLTAQLYQPWQRDDGAQMTPGALLIDSGWQTQTVYQFCRETPYNVTPAKGLGIGAANKPLHEYRRQAGDKFGHHWRMPTTRGTKNVRTIHVDTNYWKSFLHARLAIAPGDRGALTFWGRKAARHRMVADHFHAENRVPVEARGRTVDQWMLKPGQDNHLFDAAVGCAVAAATLGAALLGEEQKGRRGGRRKKRVSFKERQARRRQ